MYRYVEYSRYIMDIHVKAYLQGADSNIREIRCFVVEKDNVRCFEHLRRTCINVFSNLKEQIIFAMFYKDRDGELVSFSSDDELWMGLHCMSDQIFRIFLKEMRSIKSWTFFE